MSAHIICYDAGFVHLGRMVARLPKRMADRPIPVDLGVSTAELADEKTRRKTSVTLQNVRRIIKQVDAVRAIHYAYEPVAYFIELPHSGAKSAMALKGMAYATSYLVTALHMLCGDDVPITFFLPYAIKAHVAGDSKASKLAVAQAVIDYWPEVADWPGYKVVNVTKQVDGKKITVQDKALSHDATDAGAVCMTAMTTAEYKSLWRNDRARRSAGADWTEF